jgi:hypothetical protein
MSWKSATRLTWVRARWVATTARIAEEMAQRWKKPVEKQEKRGARILIDTTTWRKREIQRQVY